MKRSLVAAGTALLVVLAGCGGDDADTATTAADADANAAGGTSLAGSADADRMDTDLSGGTDTGAALPTAPEPELVTPRPGMTNVRPVAWESADPRGKRTVRVVFYGGVEPCDVLDSVKVAYAKQKVTISLFSGSDPAEPDSVCIELAKRKAVDVKLTEDLGGRRLVDGAPDPGTASGEPDEANAAVGRAPEGKAIKPVPGQVGVEPLSYERVEILDARTLRIHFIGNIGPCKILDRVEVTYTKAAVTITLFAGNDPEWANTQCPPMPASSYTDVTLDSDIGEREIIDGAA